MTCGVYSEHYATMESVILDCLIIALYFMLVIHNFKIEVLIGKMNVHCMVYV